MAAGSVVATTCAAVRLLGLRAFDFALATGLAAGFPAALPLAFLTTTARAIFRPPIGLQLRDYVNLCQWLSDTGVHPRPNSWLERTSARQLISLLSRSSSGPKPLSHGRWA